MTAKDNNDLASVFNDWVSVKQPANADSVALRTDAYFDRTQQIVHHYGDKEVVYAVFLRRPVLSAPRLVLQWLDQIFEQEKIKATYYVAFPEGEWVGAGQPILYLKGSFEQLVVLETILLQKLGVCCVAACNAFQMAQALPEVDFIAMGARHCAGYEMQELVEYAAWVGTQAAQKKSGSKGFIGTAAASTATMFGLDAGMGTMPHALVGYAGSTVRAAEMFHEQFPDQILGVLVDYFGKEVTDGIAVCQRFPELADQGKISLRLDTHGGRFLEGLNRQTSYSLIMRHAPETLQRYCSEKELTHLTGTGVSAAAIWWMRERLNEAGFKKVKLIASSGFDVTKCRMIAEAKAPVDCIGTGSFIPSRWSETYATADIIAYNGQALVKQGREFLINFARQYVPGL
ncbi:beta/alpha barrel domain-containing protein [Commensalibacter communis]|uniref:Nicotinic acid phosphoribosyltransferase (PncB) n=1 Tax=Commensalibacter communis TaxID=2972786 RepID=A0A9W4TLJ5_9PROT|nr:nicotinate phosphoribosyltransferase [Commensalibacter communis]CAI3926431.1 Nicotinic acid phosphoribosyltransferase (PncB) (PDB:1VLP) [Commensalibacter communis]CAI3926768.1 Nicotinic acid phosphoribosyltransferase (PncB) (PDB:1VLP) [Commensalibacter communis]CAI3928252.1 Nicotinic acid phosphoribosyltransferase (PncB) (PDB:1VLP) [Commensalibacter communis]CAI3928283.1 Nicotinic acid phosphoribosyltransferase (PncB) (PDB:1VLP) [Commensalibacter communis]CAI3934219.1 Nicotinic acid phospho